MRRLGFVFIFAQLAVGTAIADDTDYVPNLGGAVTPATQEVPPATEPERRPVLKNDSKPCVFGPITMRIDPLEMSEIVETAESPRAAWEQILELEEDPDLPPLNFAVATPDDGGEDVNCPPPPTPW